MTETPTATSEEAARDGRGVLEVREKAVQHLVEAVVGEIAGTTVRRAGLADKVPTAIRMGATGRYPHASVQMRGDHARVVVDVACRWPAPVADVARRVRDGVVAEATRLSGVTICDVDVTVHTLTDGDSAEEGRVR